MTVQYAVPFEGKLYGPFTTNDASVNHATTDAQYWANQNNLGGAPVMELLTPSSFVPAITNWSETSG